MTISDFGYVFVGALFLIILATIAQALRMTWHRWRHKHKQARHRANVYKDVVRRVK